MYKTYILASERLKSYTMLYRLFSTSSSQSPFLSYIAIKRHYGLRAPPKLVGGDIFRNQQQSNKLGTGKFAMTILYTNKSLRLFYRNKQNLSQQILDILFGLILCNQIKDCNCFNISYPQLCVVMI